jgi:hypothetical protein
MSYLGTQPNDVKKNTGLYTPSEILKLTKDGSWGGSLELIEEQTFTNSSADFVSIQENKYDVLKFEFVDLTVGIDEDLYFRVSNDNGSSFIAGTNYQYASQRGYADATFTEKRATGQSKVYVAGKVDANDLMSGYMYLYNAGNINKYTFGSFHTTYFGTTSYAMQFGGLVYANAEIINGVRFGFSTSLNSLTGTIKLYGVKQI